MGELFDYLKSRYIKTDSSETKDMMQKQRVKNGILSVCDKHLQDTEELLTFEVRPSDLQYVAEILDEEPLKSKYQIIQVSETLFTARLRELEL